MKGKRLLIVGAALALAVSGCASATRLTRMNPLKDNPVTGSYTLTFDSNTKADGSGNSCAADGSTALTTSNFFTAGSYYFTASSVKYYWIVTGYSNVASVSSTENCYPGKDSTLKVGKAKGDGSVAFTVGGSSSLSIDSVVVTAYGSGNTAKITINEANADTKQWTLDTESGSHTFVYESSVKTVTLTGGAGLTSSNKIAYISEIVINYSVDGSSSSSSSSSSEPSSSESSSSSNGPTTIVSTFAETLAAGKALANNTSSTDYYKFQGYVREKSGTNYFLTATADETYNSENAIELYKAGQVSELADILLQGAKVEVTMLLKNYNGTVENSNTLTASDVTLISQGTAWPVTITDVTVPEAIQAANALSNNQTSSNFYRVRGFIVAITYAWSSNNFSFTLGETATSTDCLTVYKCGAAENQIGSAFAVGDEISVVGNLQKYVKNSVITPELVNGSATLVNAGSNHPVDVTDVDAESTPKSVAEVKAYTAPDNSLIAKVTGVTDALTNANFGNFVLVNPATGDTIVVYGGYSDATFQKTVSTYSTKTKTTPVTDSIIGHLVTVYGTIGYHDNAGQLVDALVVDGANASVNASISVNDNNMGSATISATSSIAYNSELVVAPSPATGYRVKSVVVERINGSEVLSAESNGTYKFNAKSKNAVLVTFEAIPTTVMVSLAKYNFENTMSTTAPADGATIKGWFKKVSGDDVLSSVSDDFTKVLPGAGGGSGTNSWTTGNALKIGAASAGGSATLNLSQQVGKVVITGYAWKNTLSLTVGSKTISPALESNIANKENVESGNAGKITFEIDPSDSITISTTSTAVLITSIEFFKEASAKDAIAGLSTRSSLSYSYDLEIVNEVAEYTYSDVAIRFGGFVSVEFWNALNGPQANKIKGYGVIAAATSDLGGKTIKAKFDEAIDDGNSIDIAINEEVCNGTTIRNFYTDLALANKEHPASASATQKAEQKVDTNEEYYVWNLYKRISTDDLTKPYSAIAYIMLDDEVVFFSEVSKSVKDCAGALIDNGIYEADQFEGSLSDLAGLQ